MFSSLRSKLVASYSLLILVCLLLAGSAFVLQLREYQRQIRLNQLADLATPITWQIRLLERAGASGEQVTAFLQDRSNEMGVRILLVDNSGLVVVDSSGGLEGDRLQMPAAWHQTRDDSAFAVVATTRSVRQGYVFIAAAPRPGPPQSDRTPSLPPVRSSGYSVVLAVPEQSVTQSWLDLAPSLSGAALLSLIVSIGIAWFLSRSISRPVTAVTRASEEMARGNYDQHIPVHGRDEVGRLAEAFNHMATQVSTSHRTLKDFLANVSHELRTPLTSVHGFSQAMVDGTLKEPGEYVEAARIINDEAERMREMVEGLLLLSKIESGQMSMNQASLDLRELLRATLKRMAPQAQQRGITMELLAREAVTIMGDETRLEQLFQNLLSNALRHTPIDGAVRVELVATHLARLGEESKSPAGKRTRESEVRVSVHNSGSYIPPEERSRIFERFYQLDRARERKGDGAGLGLAIAQEIAAAHGATISVESEPESGTTFAVTFRPRQTSAGTTPNLTGP